MHSLSSVSILKILGHWPFSFTFLILPSRISIAMEIILVSKSFSRTTMQEMHPEGAGNITFAQLSKKVWLLVSALACNCHYLCALNLFCRETFQMVKRVIHGSHDYFDDMCIM